MAELYQATRGRQRAREGGSLAVDGAHGGALGARRLSPRARVRRRPAPDRLAILHELRRAPVHSGRSPGRGGVRTVPPVVPARRREGLGEGPLAPRPPPHTRPTRRASGQRMVRTRSAGPHAWASALWNASSGACPAARVRAQIADHVPTYRTTFSSRHSCRISREGTASSSNGNDSER